jgi:Ca-activated chloride channel family protein
MEQVDLALVLALDGSASVTFEEFGLMASGCAAAFRAPDVVSGLIGGPLRGSLVALLLWAGRAAQDVLVDWRRLGSEADVQGFADELENVPRTVPAGSTAIGEALKACERLLADQPAPARRQVIDIAGDGRWNEGEPPMPVRDRLAAAGVTINGLCVLHEEADLVASYTSEVIGGPDCFALPCENYQDFADALRQKLQREIAAVPAQRTDRRA